jgi:4-hydroxybenzoate polyprenyltransferase
VDLCRAGDVGAAQLFYDRKMTSLWRSTVVTLEMIKWEHSVFALPFALTGAVLAAGGWPTLRVLLWIVVCMVSARSAAMAFNRLADARLDAENPRTAMRALPAGTLSNGFVGGFVVVSAALFVLASAMLNRLTLELAPLALIVVLSYSYMKRLTRWSHAVLGLALGIAPSAAWIAVRGTLDARILVLTGAVLLWVGGFDVLYACQDFEHDRKVGLNSVPQAFGLVPAFWIARAMHLGMLLMLCWLIVLFGLGKIAMLGVAIVAALLLYEHSIISPKDLRRMNAAFFTLNGVISVMFFGFVAADVLLRR